MPETKNIVKTLFAPVSTKLVLKTIFYLIIIVTLVMFWYALYVVIDESSSWEEDDSYWEESEETSEAECNVAGIVLSGDLLTYVPNCNENAAEDCPTDVSSSEELVHYIEQAEKDKTAKAILLEVDSMGGEPVAAEELAQAIKRAQKPVVAMIRAYGDSAAYYAASAADIIFAQKNSDVGGIGVSLGYLDNSAKNQKEGIVFQDLSAGRFKNAGNPDKPLTTEERAYLERDAKVMHENFIVAVAEQRGLPIEDVRALADGSTMLGEMALEKGLIDRIGGIYEVKDWLREQIGEEAEVCWN